MRFLYFALPIHRVPSDGLCQKPDEGEALIEDSTVTVVVREDDETFELTTEEEAELLASIADIERGEFISGEELLQRLRRIG